MVRTDKKHVILSVNVSKNVSFKFTHYFVILFFLAQPCSIEDQDR